MASSYESTSSYRKVCPCNPHRVFTAPSAYRNHLNACAQSKEALLGSVSQIREAREAAQARRSANQTDLTVDVSEAASSSSSIPATSSLFPESPAPAANSSAISDFVDALSSSEPPPAKRRRKMPARFTQSDLVLNDPDLVDFLPAPLAIVPASTSDSAMPDEPPSQAEQQNIHHETPHNNFG
ncbi:hypothetical protein DXG01_008234, partial [Tephrocybe rancida]